MNEALRSPGQPLDAAARSLMETRFGHDFSRVRVHADAEAAESARSVDALAYTAGMDVVFGTGQYAPGTASGLRLLAHELAHVIQQGSVAGTPEAIDDPGSRAESEADAAADKVVSGSAAAGISQAAVPAVRRKITVDKPKEMIPNKDGKGLKQTNAATVQDYLDTMCVDGKPKVNATSGAVSIPPSFCFAPGFSAGHEALPAGEAPLEKSKTKSGCSCICDLVYSDHLWTVKVDDSSRPHTAYDDDDAARGKKEGGTGGSVTTISPNSPSVFGSVSVSGKRIDYDPWLILGHELCGHGWLANYGMAESEEIIEEVGRQPLTVDRENALRAEHSIEARGRSYRDPYCGESYERLKTEKPGKGKFKKSLLELCNWARSRCEKPGGGKYKLEEKIPADVKCDD